MRVRVLTFAGIREIVGEPSRTLALPEGATAADAWNALAGEFPALAAIAGSTRLARNGAFIDGSAALREGDELAVLPPFGGG
jgi:molybdopterin converting factor small subunit